MKSNENNTDKTGLPHNYQDVLLKNLTDNNLGELFELFDLDIDSKDLRPISNEGNLIQISQDVYDRAFECSDGSIVDLEFDSTGKLSALIRYIEYAFLLFINNIKKNKIIAPVTIIVIYPADVTVPELDDLLIGNKVFVIQQKSLSQHINGPELVKNLTDMKDSGINPFKYKENVVKLPLAILGQVRNKRHGFFLEGLKLVKPFSDDPVAKYVLTLMSLAVSQTLDKKELQLLLKEFSMENLLELADVFSDGQFTLFKSENAELKAKLEVVELKAKLEVAEFKAEVAELKAENAELKFKLESAELKGISDKIRSDNDDAPLK
jgi:hypothetical protein